MRQGNSMIIFKTMDKQHDHTLRKWAGNIIISRVTGKQHDHI